MSSGGRLPPVWPRSTPAQNADPDYVSIDTLAEFVARLEQAGELVRIKQPVSLDLDLCEIADRVMKQPGGGKALVFERPILMNGSPSRYPVAINLFGSMRRMSMELETETLDG